MNLLCIKCKNKFTDESSIYATTCGHIFHYHCLLEWLKRFQTCPHCTQRQIKQDIFRLYLSSSDVLHNDPQELKNEFNSLSKELEIKNHELKTLKEETSRLKSRQKELRKERSKLKSEEDAIKKTMSYNHFVTGYYRRISKGKNLSEYEAKADQLRKHLCTLEGMNEIVNAPDSDIDAILEKSTLSQADLLFCANLFETKLNACNERNEELDDDVMLHDMESDRLQTELQSVKVEHSTLLQQALDLCGSEQSELRQNITLADLLNILPDLPNCNQSEQTEATVPETSTSSELVDHPLPNSALRKRCKEVIKLAMRNPREYLTSGRVELYDSEEDSHTELVKKTDCKPYTSSKLNNNFNHEKYKKRIRNKHLSADCGLLKKPKGQKIDLRAIDRSVYELMAADYNK